MIYGVLDKDGENDVGQLAGSAATGAPIGTWASFEKDYAPNIEWLQGGTTFNPNTYPALAMYLGGTKVPERYDHSRPSEYEVVTISSSSANPTRIEWDCDITIQGAWNDGAFAYINGSSTPIWGMESNSGGTTVQTGWISLKKGDTIWGSGLGNNYQDRVPMRIRYYKHPMFIKATPTSADSDYEGVLNGIRTYVRNSNSYSTEEQPTGGYWIDGKPIYRKVVLFTTAQSWGAYVWAVIPNSATDVPNAEQVTTFVTLEEPITGKLSVGYHGEAYANNGIYYYSTISMTYKGYIVEYTKTV